MNEKEDSGLALVIIKRILSIDVILFCSQSFGIVEEEMQQNQRSYSKNN